MKKKTKSKKKKLTVNQRLKRLEEFVNRIAMWVGLQ